MILPHFHLIHNLATILWTDAYVTVTGILYNHLQLNLTNLIHFTQPFAAYHLNCIARCCFLYCITGICAWILLWSQRLYTRISGTISITVTSIHIMFYILPMCIGLSFHHMTSIQKLAIVPTLNLFNVHIANQHWVAIYYNQLPTTLSFIYSTYRYFHSQYLNHVVLSYCRDAVSLSGTNLNQWLMWFKPGPLPCQSIQKSIVQ